MGRNKILPFTSFRSLSVSSAAFYASLNGRGLFTGIDDLAGACQKLLLFDKENTQCRDHRESGGSVPDGEIQEFNCCLWFHNQVVSLCLCLCWLSCCERSQRGAWCKSSGSPEKQVSQLFINCQVLGFRTGMWAVCKGCWER